jgi:hypothetical protein
MYGVFLCPEMLCCAVLRAAPMVRDDFRSRPTGDLSRSQMILIETFSSSIGQGLSKIAQSGRLPLRG